MSRGPIPEQLRLFQLADIDPWRFVDPLEGWDLTDVRALAMDPDVEVRQVVARCRWNIDVRVQFTLATDPDELVVLELLSGVDVGLEAVCQILNGTHTTARRVVAGRNLSNDLLAQMLYDLDREVAATAALTLRSRDVAVVPEVRS